MHIRFITFLKLFINYNYFDWFWSKSKCWSKTTKNHKDTSLWIKATKREETEMTLQMKRTTRKGPLHRRYAIEALTSLKNTKRININLTRLMLSIMIMVTENEPTIKHQAQQRGIIMLVERKLKPPNPEKEIRLLKFKCCKNWRKI